MTADATRRESVVVVGGGPAGLTAATNLARRGHDVVVLEREADAGGIPRHSDHTGYGMRDLHRVMRGPGYARHLVDRALTAGARIETGTMVTGWSGARTLETTSSTGRKLVEADAVVLATGARERPRPARLIPGDRPRGVLTTGELQNLVYLHNQPVGRRAVIVGAELVSWSAALTLRHAGCAVVGMVSAHPRPEIYRPVAWAGRYGLRIPVTTSSRLVQIRGRQRVEAVELEHLPTGRRTDIACDTVVFTGDWIPDHELARIAGLELEPRSGGPVVDTALRTSHAGVFAAGNLIHPVDTADVAALDGAHGAAAVDTWLKLREWPTAATRITAAGALLWIAPGRLDPRVSPSRGRLLGWGGEHLDRPRVTVQQGGQTLAERGLPWPLALGRMFRIPAGVLQRVDPAGPPVVVTVGQP